MHALTSLASQDAQASCANGFSRESVATGFNACMCAPVPMGVHVDLAGPAFIPALLCCLRSGWSAHRCAYPGFTSVHGLHTHTCVCVSLGLSRCWSHIPHLLVQYCCICAKFVGEDCLHRHKHTHHPHPTQLFIFYLYISISIHIYTYMHVQKPIRYSALARENGLQNFCRVQASGLVRGEAEVSGRLSRPAAWTDNFQTMQEEQRPQSCRRGEPHLRHRPL